MIYQYFTIIGTTNCIGIKLFYLSVSNYVLTRLMENACMCKVTTYILVVILFISLFYSRVLRAQDYIEYGFSPNRKQIHTKYKGSSNESLDKVLYKPESFKKDKYKLPADQVTAKFLPTSFF